MLKENFEEILKNYVQAKSEPFRQHNIANLIRSDVVNNFKQGIGEKYLIKASPGQGNWADTPWISFFNEKITISAQKGYYVVYLFKPDMSGVYLSLNFGTTNFNTEYGRKRLSEAAENFRSTLLDHFPNINYQPMELVSSENKNDKPEDYENANIYSIYYPRDEIPSDEKLLDDLNFFFKLYDYLYNVKGTEIFPKEPIENTELNKEFTFRLKKEGFFFEKNIIENYLLSLKVKPFVILTGNSGTGKTKLAQLFAKYLQEKLDYPFGDNYAVVAVGANWTDNRNIIGYYNPLLKRIEETPTSKFIKRANDDLHNPYFLILDEMNLSYVERYFSDFLSALESGEKMDIPGASGSENLSDDEKTLKIPPNLFVVGTVNVDETTYMFSPKVLDRANVLEFKTIPVEKYMDMDFDNNFDEKYNMNFLENPLEHISFKKNTKKDEEETDTKQIDINDLKEKYSQIINTNDLWDQLSDNLTELHEILQKSGFDFGFRVTNEILSFILEASKYEEEFDTFQWERYLDAQILQKVLPKIHGSKTQIEEMLTDLFKYCVGEEKINSIKDINYELNEENTKYYHSARKLYQMITELNKSRYVSFIS